MRKPDFETHWLEPKTGPEREVAALDPWFQNLHLPDGTQTAPHHPLGDFPACKWRELAPHLPASLRGWRALDIGCNAGFYSFELARRGAEVTGIDNDPHYLEQARWAAKRLGLEDAVRFEETQIHDLARRQETYDLVLFLGVFYHLRYPLLALDTVVRKTERLLVFQSLTVPGEEVRPARDNVSFDARHEMREPGWPMLALVEGSFAGDPTNWWVPNHAAIEAMLRLSGMRVLARPGTEMYLCEPDPDFASLTRDLDESEYRAAAGTPPRARSK
jgi:tRNA (mo5U34)-methyltransferase